MAVTAGTMTASPVSVQPFAVRTALTGGVPATTVTVTGASPTTGQLWPRITQR